LREHIFDFFLVKGAAAVLASHSGGVLVQKCGFEVEADTEDGCAEVKIFWARSQVSNA
jgi:hypothetical protein